MGTTIIRVQRLDEETLEWVDVITGERQSIGEAFKSTKEVSPEFVKQQDQYLKDRVKKGIIGNETPDEIARQLNKDYALGKEEVSK